jgi:outer membrane protein TolC
MNLFRSLLLGLLFALGACASVPPAPTVALQSAAEFAGRSLTDPGLKGYLEMTLGQPLSAWPAIAWDEQTLTLAAFYYQPELGAARARWGTARAAEVTAGGHPAPTLGLLPEYNVDAPANVSPWTVSLSLNLPIETAGKRQYRLAQARQLSEAARLDVASTAWRVRSRVRAALLDLYAARCSIALLGDQLDLAKGRLEIARQRLEVGAAARPDAVEASAALEQTRLALPQAEQRALAAQSALARAIGVSIEALQEASLSFSEFETVPSQAAPASSEARRLGLSSRPDVLAALAQYAASESALQLALANRVPNIEIGPGYKWDEGQVKWSIGLAVTLPIASAGPIAEAAAGRDEAAARFNNLQAKAIGEVDQASAAYRLAVQEVGAAQATADAAQEQMQAVELQFQAGEADRLVLLGARLRIAVAQQAQLSARIDAHRALGALEDALQQPLAPSALPVPYEDPRAQVNQGAGR